MSEAPRARHRRGWIKRSLIIAVASVIVLAGLLVGGVRLLDHVAPQYRHALAERIGQRIDANVTVSGLEIGWGWHGPILYLDDPRITRRGADAPALTADRLGLEFSLADLIGGSRLPDGLILDAPQVGLVQTGSGLGLAHWGASQGGNGMDWSKLAAVRRQIAHVRIHDGRLTITADRLPGGHMQWSNLDLTLDDHDDRHLQLAASAEGPAWWPSLDASATIDGALRRPEHARFSLRGADILALALARHNQTKIASRLRGGRLSFNVDGAWRNDRLAETRITLDGDALTRRHGDQPLVPAFHAVFKAASDPDAHRVGLDLVRLTGGPPQAGAFDAKAHFNTRSHALDVSARHLPGALALRIARLAEPRLRDTAVDGSIDALDVHWQPGQPLAAQVGFHGLTVDDPKIAFGPIAGRYRQQGDRHTLSFDGAGGALSAAHYIKGDVDITGLGGQMSWQPGDSGGWSIDLDKLRLASHQAHVVTSGQVRLPAEGAPIADITADVVAPHVARLLAHIPQAEDLPNPRLRDWLPKAILAGSLDHGHVTVKGPMSRFPFVDARNGNGFHMTLAGHGVDVRYKPDWPKVTEAGGTLSLDGDTLALDLDGAKMLGVTIDSAQAHVDDVREPVMRLTGKTSGAPATKLLSFLSESPLHKKFGKLVDAIDVSGPADLDVDLRIPLKPGLGDVAVDGRIDTRGDTLRQDTLPGPITCIRGRLSFSDHGVQASGLTGQLLDVPISADITPASDGGQRITAHAKPSLPANSDALAHYLPDAWLIYGKGQTPITVAFTVERSGQISPIEVDSDLAGMAIRLPAPLTKPAAAKAPLSATIEPDSGDIEAEYDNRLHLTVDLDTDGKPQRIHALIGDTDLTPPDTNGLWIGGHADQVDGLGWFYVVRHVLYGAPAAIPDAPETAASTAGHSKTTADSATDLAFLGGDLTIGRLNFGDRYIAQPHVRAQPMSDTTGWRVDFEGDDSQGQITWTTPAGQATRVAGNLKRVAVHTESTQPSTSENDSSDDSTVLWPDLAPTDLPAMKLFIQNFVVDDTSFGQTHVDATGTADGWRLDRFQLADGALTGLANAHWQQDSGVSRAGAHADFDGHGLSRLLRTFGYVSPIRAKQARIKTDLTIKPNQNGLDLRHLDGRVRLALDHGTLLTVEPGPGRLLGLFNLYVLPRRLRLDFRDVVDKGMAFDKIRADFKIRQGQAYSNNAHILTPSAKIGITGRIGLATRDYDEFVTITPKVGSGVAIASAVFGGPIVGAAVFAVQQLLKKPIQHFSSVGYNLKGSWDDPQIVNPRADDGSDDAESDAAQHDDSESPGK